MSKAFPIKGFSDYYVTDTGDVYSRNYNHTGRIKKIKPCNNNCGYMQIFLMLDNKKHTKYIHRLVAEAFIPNPNNKPEVNHKDGNKNNNNVYNLEWVTKSENSKHRFNKLGQKSPMLGKLGKNNPLSKIVLQIENEEIVAEFYGTAEAQRKTGVGQSHIAECCRGEKKSAGGYQWKYKQNY